ncbi:hypothetical protein [Methylosinus sporium]|uniref:hypothetical protein n=1 Tax=Methylosinus sporium TaxID=428 RepID=UPI00383B0730
MIALKIKTGEIVEMPGGRFRVARELSGGSLLFTREDTLGEKIVSEREIEQLIAHGKFRRVATHTNAREREEPNPIAEIPPEGASDEARAKIFYVRKWLENPTAKSDKKLDQFIERIAPVARARGITYKPEKATLRRAIYAYLNQGRQTTATIASQRGKVPRKPKMHQCVAAIMKRTVAWYYARRARDFGQAHAWLVKFIDKINRRASRKFEGWNDLTPPNEETTRAHIRAAENHDNWAAKTTPREARERFRGTAPGICADRILEYLMIDSTIADVWVFDLERGIPLGRPTITAAIDVHSRMVLAIVVTFEPPSLYTAMRALYESNRPKQYWLAEQPGLKPYDGWGKTSGIIVDNALEQIGVSFQDACEDAGISVEWAPVATPPYKAIGERLFGTLNRGLLHKCQGGVPFPANLMKKFELDPKKDACIELESLHELVRLFLCNTYQMRVHKGIGMAPARAWQESKNAPGDKGGRAFIDDLSVLRTAFGAYGEAMLSREGIRFRGMRFHHKDEVSRLLDALGVDTPIRKRRVGSATVRVKLKYDPSDASALNVWNDRTRTYARLPNVDSKFAAGLSFTDADRIREYAKKENLNYQSDQEKWLARDKLRVEIESAAGDAKYKWIRKKRRLMHPPEPLSGDTVERVTATPTANGLGPADVAMQVTLNTRDDGGFPEKGPRRGGKKSGNGGKPKRKPDARPATPSKPEVETASRDPFPKVSAAFATLDQKKIDALDW